ncbi:MAG TPA: IS110 family transposase [Candidatus Latescibacteria bacterium]|nr:IS110 family transposase [Candidatus Handelsmanbacteria bacterium]HIL11446.1 IS110 family transposase [Candidatus Latescibacterota bacterium]
MNQWHHMGIDVSAKTLDVALTGKDIPITSATFPNTSSGHRQLIKWATKRGRSARVCLEATGIYSAAIALVIHQHPRLEIMVVNPKAMRNYGQARMQRAKTDRIDAQLILDYGQRMPFVSWHPPSEAVLKLQAITRRITPLKNEIQREKNRLHADSYRVTSTDLIEQDIRVHIRHMERRIQYLTDKGMVLVQEASRLHRLFQRLLSIPGIGQTSGLRILAELASLPRGMKPAQWVAHAGLDPRPYESGSSVHRPQKIAKIGNKFLRTALYMPALVAIRHQPQVNAFYNKLIAAGKNPRLAITAVMRKLLHSVWGIWKYDQDFDGQKFYRTVA